VSGGDTSNDTPGGVHRIVLVGFMGSGKSTVGPELAQILGWEFVDLDRRVEEEAGLSVAQIFERHGESEFREAERRAAEGVARQTRVVVAAGGGAFVFPRTRQALTDGALTVWLSCDLDTVLARVPADGLRPLAKSRETIERLFAERQPSYRLADWSVDASRSGPAALARRIADALSSGRPLRAGGTTDR
jgi:shikimate kinase